jgi:hypothetical protein
MPMRKGCSSKQIGKNISDMLMHQHGHKKTYTQKQAVKVALDFARKQGCPIPKSNPLQNVLDWFRNIYEAGQYAAEDTISSIEEAESISIDDVNTHYKYSMREVETQSNVIFNKIEKSLFLEGFLHKLMNL